MSNNGSTKTSGDRQIRRANLTFPPCPRSPRENQLASSPVSASRASAPARCTCSCQRPAPTSALGNLTQKIWARSRFVIRADFAPVPPLCYVSLKKLQAEQTSRARYLQEVRAAGSNKKWMCGSAVGADVTSGDSVKGHQRDRQAAHILDPTWTSIQSRAVFLNPSLLQVFVTMHVGGAHMQAEGGAGREDVYM